MAWPDNFKNFAYSTIVAVESDIVWEKQEKLILWVEI
jgi:hypothetical protein